MTNKVIIQKDETIIIEEEKDEEMEDSQPQRGQTASYVYSSDSTDSTKSTAWIPWKTDNNADSHLQTESA